MHQKYFPRCPIDGPIEPPVPYAHMASAGAVPAKCAKCRYLFEGECTRYAESVGGYLHLDHGPCGINGPTDPVKYEDEFVESKVEVPRKCVSCYFLAVDSIYGFHCTKDADKWGDFHRGLDWGSWQPNEIYLQLPAPKVTTRQLVQFAYDNDMVSFIREYRRLNPGFTADEGKVDFAHFRNRIDHPSE